MLSVHIGEAESSALLKEINKQKGSRPLTHDLAKGMLIAVGCRVTKVRITELVSSTYYSRIHVARVGSSEDVGPTDGIDARPSDAINLAVRFHAPIYISQAIAETAAPFPTDTFPSQSETEKQITQSVRETLASFEDPTTMLQLQKELAIKEERYTDAHVAQQAIFEEMTHSPMLRLVVAMEAALGDGRYEEAARARDEYRRLVAQQQVLDSAGNTRRS
ncbi:hypothetical protein FOA52_002294 [Chlamydomonas sp. UWO 241]|nr:hypothetical protein FOA52_002294 [Chlamydomonas sp. UWO 241]